MVTEMCRLQVLFFHSRDMHVLCYVCDLLIRVVVLLFQRHSEG